MAVKGKKFWRAQLEWMEKELVQATCILERYMQHCGTQRAYITFIERNIAECRDELSKLEGAPQ